MKIITVEDKNENYLMAILNWQNSNFVMAFALLLCKKKKEDSSCPKADIYIIIKMKHCIACKSSVFKFI